MPKPDFYPRSPCGERLHLFASSGVDFTISIHALLAESDTFACWYIKEWQHFYPRSPCGERHTVPDLGKRDIRISIHALLAESDPRSSKTARRFPYFYPRSPCGERLCIHFVHLRKNIFLSTLSLRRATYHEKTTADCFSISIHALLAESDNVTCGDRHKLRDFYPRSPCGERPLSVHDGRRHRYFYPRSPCGERQLAARDCLANAVFLSTLSLRRATYHEKTTADCFSISIHALLAESDLFKSPLALT